MSLGLEWRDIDDDAPRWICAPCGDKHGRRQTTDATWHYDTCDLCETADVPVTEVRYYGGLR